MNEKDLIRISKKITAFFDPIKFNIIYTFKKHEETERMETLNIRMAVSQKMYFKYSFLQVI